MIYRFLLLSALGLALFALGGVSRSQDDRGAGNVAPTKSRTPEGEKKAFHLPPGFEAQLVAAEPDIHKPMNIAFDARGRLWVTDTVEYPFPAPPGRKPRDTVKVLEDFGPDGRARKITTFADGLNIPIGLLPLTPAPSPPRGEGGKGDEALVFSIPAIRKLSDTDGDGKADKRTVLYAKYGQDDTHGLTSAFTRGFDGWVYACHGFRNDSTVKASDGSSVTMNSGNTYRMKADGSHIEQFTHGQVNPFGLSFDSLGNLYSADCHSQPLYLLLRGAYYPSFGKPHDGLGFGPQTVTRYNGSTAIAGAVHYSADHFPAKYRGHVFVGDVVTNRINLFRLEWQGSTPRASQEGFLRSDDPWFRPVDLELGPDGALYVADFYNRIIGHYEVPLNHPGRDRRSGRIWRIVYRGADGKSKPAAPRSDWTKASVKELVKDLSHANLAVRTIATNELVRRGGAEGIKTIRPVMKPESNVWQRVHGLWVLERQRKLDDETLKAAADDKEMAVRVHAQRVLSERAKLSAAQRKLARAGLKDADAHVRRAAAAALGQHPDAENLRPLLDLRHVVAKEDTHLLHVVRMALRNQLRDLKEWPLPLSRWSERDADAIADVALGVPNAESARYLFRHVTRRKGKVAGLVPMVHHVARHGDEETIKALLAFARGHRPENAVQQANLLKAIARGTAERGESLNAQVLAWAEDLTGRLLGSKVPGEVRAGIDLVGALKLPSGQDALVKLLRAGTVNEEGRLAALNALAAIDAGKHVGLFGKLLTNGRQSFRVRERCANLLAAGNRPAGHIQLVEALKAAPARLQTVIAAGLAGSRGGAEKLLKAVEEGKASARLLQERAVEVRLQAANVPDLKRRVAKLTDGLPPADQRLRELFRKKREAYLAGRWEVRRGEQAFEKHCAACHQVGGKGAKVGPQLDGIGVRGLDRLLEDMLDPNRNVDQAFRLTTLETKGGQVVSGLLLREEGAVLVLADNQGKEVRVPKNEVAERTVSPISPMPANLVDQIPEEDLYQMLRYLLSQRPAEK